MMYNDINHVFRKSSLLRPVKIMEHSLIAKPNTTTKVWYKLLDFSTDQTKTITSFIEKRLERLGSIVVNDLNGNH